MLFVGLLSRSRRRQEAEGEVCVNRPPPHVGGYTLQIGWTKTACPPNCHPPEYGSDQMWQVWFGSRSNLRWLSQMRRAGRSHRQLASEEKVRTRLDLDPRRCCGCCPRRSLAGAKDRRQCSATAPHFSASTDGEGRPRFRQNPSGGRRGRGTKDSRYPLHQGAASAAKFRRGCQMVSQSGRPGKSGRAGGPGRTA